MHVVEPRLEKASRSEISRSIDAMLQRNARFAPDAPAICAPGREILSHSRLFDLAHLTVKKLRAIGIGRDDRLAVVLPNGPEMATAFLGIAVAATCAPLNPAYRSSELDFYLSDLLITALVVQAESDSPAKAVAASRGIPVIELSAVQGEPAGMFDLISTSPLASPSHDGPTVSEDTALLLHTSGTTSRPKLVPLTQANICISASNIFTALNLTPHDRCLSVMPLFHIHGLIGALLSSVAAGASIVCTPGFYANRFFEWVSEFAPSWYTAVPTMHQSILARSRDNSEIISRSRLKFIRSCSAAMPPQVMADLEEAFHVPLIEAYGMTEASHQMASNPLPPGIRKPRSVGKATGTEISIMDEAGTHLPIGAVGEVVIRGQGVTAGYECNPEANEKSYTDGWFRTGDQGYLDEDGYLFLTGRIKEIINRAGEKIAPLEIDHVLLDHPAVDQAVAFSLPDPFLGEEVAAAVVLRAGETATQRELQELAATRLADFKVPRKILFLEEIPKGPTGKLQRVGLAERLGLTAETSASASPEPHTPPTTPVELEIARLWSDLLGLKELSIHSNFFQLGGDSILAAQVISRIRLTMRVGLSFVAFLDSPTIAGLAQALQDAREGETEATDGTCQLPQVVPDPPNRHRPFPLNDMQQAYWVGRSASFQLGNVAAHSYAEMEAEDLDLDRLNEVWQKLIERHDALRTITLPDGRQQILQYPPFYRIEIQDFSGLTFDEAMNRVEDLRHSLSHQILNTNEWPLFDVQASRIDGVRTRLHFSLDGMVLDAWSRSILFSELSELYSRPDRPLPPLELSFRDYTLAQMSIRGTELYRRSQEYWRNRLPSLPLAPELPLAKVPDAIGTPRFRRFKGGLDPERWSRVKHRAKKEGITPSALLLTAFSEVLGLWSKSARFTLNIPHFNRLPLHPQVEEILGEFASLTFLPVDTLAERTFQGRAQRLQRELWENLDHSHVSGVSILRELAQLRGLGPGAIMPVVFTSIPRHNRSKTTSDAPSIGKVVHTLSQTPQVQLDLQVYEEGEALGFNWDSVEELFPDGVMEEMFSAYGRLLDDLASREEAWFASWPDISRRLIPPAQLEQRTRINATQCPIPDTLLHHLFADRVALQPDRPAVIAPERSVTYDELYRFSIQTGHRLRTLGVAQGSLVAVVMEKGWEQIVGVLGILFAGAAYLPLDPRQPESRLQQQLKDGEVRLALTQSHLDDELLWPEGVRRICIDAQEMIPGNYSLDFPQTPDDLAYVMYTSGSTGTPKGVMIPHRSVVNAVLDTNRRFRIGPEDRILAVTALHHDMSVFDIFGTFTAGGAIVIPDRQDRPDPAVWLDLIEKHSVTVWSSVPITMQLFVEYAAGREERPTLPLRLAFLGGDWIPLTLPGQIKALFNGCQVVSVGGPTETTLWNICYPIEDVDPTWRSIPYGRPMANTKYAILNEVLEDCPVWVTGMMYCAGDGLAKGYWRDEAKTRNAFIHHPRTGERLYRTGDLGRFLPDGTIEILGREDAQVKIRGHRIELGEIEHALLLSPGVKLAVVKAFGEPSGDRQLAAYIVPSGPLASPSDLRMHLQRLLPDYMLPSTFTMLQELPLTHSGKIDRKALPEPAHAVESGATSNPTREGLVNRIGMLVRQVLKAVPVAPDANLLCLGATSIDMVRISNLLERELGFRPRIDYFYRTPTVQALAAMYEAYLLGLRTGDFHSRLLAEKQPFWDELLLDPDERERFRSSQPGLRPCGGALPSIQLYMEEADEALLMRYAQRRTHRVYGNAPITLDSFSGLLSCLRRVTFNGRPKYLYPSSGGLYCIQSYLYVKAGRIDGVSHGTYYYDPAGHRLMGLCLGAELDRTVYSLLINRPVFDSAAFSIYLIAQLAAITPMYGEESLRLATLDAGYMGQLLVMTAPKFGMGLCPIGSLEFDRISHLFQLEDSHTLIHSLLGGLIEPESPMDDLRHQPGSSPTLLCRWENGEV